MKPTLNAIDIVVADLNTAISFYAQLGLTFVVDEYMPDHAQCDLPNGLHLMLDTEQLRGKTLSEWSRPSGGPRTFLAFEFATPAEVDAKHSELIAAGYRSAKEPWDAFWGMRYATILDPDGNGIDLYSALS